MRLDKVCRWPLMMTLLLVQLTVFSQDTSTVTTNITQTLTNDEAVWYMQPWVWIVGGVALLLILIALFSGGKKSDASSRTDKVIITKTVRTETDVDD